MMRTVSRSRTTARARNRARPNVTRLEDRATPGSLLSSCLDLAPLAGVLGENLLKPPAPRVAVHRSVQTPTAAAGTAVDSHIGAVNQTPVTGSVGSVSRLTEGLDIPTSFHQAHASLTAIGVNPSRPGDGVGTKANGNTRFWGGNSDGRNGLTDEYGTTVSDAQTFDDIRFRGVWSNDCVTGWYLLSTNATAMKVTILGPGNAVPGIHNGNMPVLFPPPMGTGIVPLTSDTLTGNNYFGYNEHQVTACGLLAAGMHSITGHYYLSAQVVGDGTGQAFVSTTSGGGTAKGSPIANGNVWLQSAYFGYPNFTDWQDLLGAGNWDISHGICSSAPCPV
jgi:hypothetical protein